VSLRSGISVGHWTGDGTGVTAILCPEGTIGSGEVRGGAPATRETALLEPGRTVERVDAVLFTGGSAFGLAAADGAMAWLAEHERGFPTRGGPVPIVPTAAIYDLVAGDARTHPPGPDAGRAAIEAAATASGPPAIGRVGAGTGATVGKWRGADHFVPGGLGTAHDADLGVDALAVVNAVGDVLAADGRVLAGSTAPADAPPFPDPKPFEATTLVAVATPWPLTKAQCHLVAQSGHDGLAMALRPAHTRHDGDLVIAVATHVAAEAEAEVRIDRLRAVVSEVVAEAIRSAVRQT
jgi:L-aminopeptidase/D-esterase-like protein